MTIRLVPQRHTTDCGVACVAMIAGVSYQQAFNAIGFSEVHKQFYTTHTCLTIALRKLGAHVRWKKFRSWHDIPGPAIVAVNHRRKCRKFHWVLYDGKRIIDPECKDRSRYCASGFYLLITKEAFS